MLPAPKLIVMLDWLATSMDAERAFSHGRLTVSRLRHSLSDDTVRTSTVLSSWARYPDLVPEGDDMDLLRRKEKGKGKDTVTLGDGAVSKQVEAITVDRPRASLWEDPAHPTLFALSRVSATTTPVPAGTSERRATRQ